MSGKKKARGVYAVALRRIESLERDVKYFTNLNAALEKNHNEGVARLEQRLSDAYARNNQLFNEKGLLGREKEIQKRNILTYQEEAKEREELISNLRLDRDSLIGQRNELQAKIVELSKPKEITFIFGGDTLSVISKVKNAEPVQLPEEKVGA